MPDNPLSSTPILIVGATGRLGRIVTRELVARGETVRVLARRPARAAELFGDRVAIRQGDLGDPESLRAAFAGAGRLFLLSPITETLVRDQVAAVDAAVAAGIRRIVKISGADWTVGASFPGDSHAAIEAHLVASGIESVAIRPNAWAQVGLVPVLRQARETGRFHARHAARVSFIDIRDIADLAVHQLLADEVAPSPLVVTGPEALSLADIAAIAGQALGRSVTLSDTRPDPDPLAVLPGFERGVAEQFHRLIAAGAAEACTDTVARLLGRPARRVPDWLAEELAAPAAA